GVPVLLDPAVRDGRAGGLRPRAVRAAGCRAPVRGRAARPRGQARLRPVDSTLATDSLAEPLVRDGSSTVRSGAPLESLAKGCAVVQTLPGADRPGTDVPQRRRLVTAVPGPRSQELMARRSAAVPPGVGTALPVFVERAGGGVLVDVDGNSLIDFGSGIAVTSVGNAAPAVVAAVAEQTARFTHTCFMITPYEGYVEVCERLNRLTPGGFEKRSMLVNSGAEAVENAVKVARAATGRPAVVVFDHGYHGRTLLTMTLRGKYRLYKAGFGPYAPEVYRAPMAYPFRWPGGADRCADEAYERFVDLVTTQVGPGGARWVVVEPIQGEGGFVVPAPGFLRRVADFCAAHGILLVADEVQTGLGRTGPRFAFNVAGA